MEENQSRADVFSKRSGSLISIEFIDIGSIDNRLRISLAKFKDLMLNQEERALRFEYDYYNGYDDYPDTKICTLDNDELEGLIKSLNIIINEVYLTNPENYVEVNFKSRSGMKAGCYYSKGDWQFFVKISEYDGNSFVFLDKRYASSLLSLLINNRQLLLNN